IVRGAHLMEPAEEETGGSGTHRVDLRAPIAVRHRPRVAGTRIDAAGSTQRTTPSPYRPCMAARSVGRRARSHPGSPSRHHLPQHRTPDMTSIITKDGTEIFYKDMGRGQPIVFHHGWPLCSDDWDAQMLFFLEQGYRVIAHDRRGHGRSSQSANGNNMDTYAADVAALASRLDLRDAIHIGHSTGGGEAARYVARHGADRVAKLVLIGAVPPQMVKTEANPGGLPIEVFDDLRAQLAASRAGFYWDFPVPF